MPANLLAKAMPQAHIQRRTPFRWRFARIEVGGLKKRQVISGQAEMSDLSD
jgi:hypothetical protein